MQILLFKFYNNIHQRRLYLFHCKIFGLLVMYYLPCSVVFLFVIILVEQEHCTIFWYNCYCGMVEHSGCKKHVYIFIHKYFSENLLL